MYYYTILICQIFFSATLMQFTYWKLKATLGIVCGTSWTTSQTDVSVSTVSTLSVLTAVCCHGSQRIERFKKSRLYLCCASSWHISHHEEQIQETETVGGDTLVQSGWMVINQGSRSDPRSWCIVIFWSLENKGRKTASWSGNYSFSYGSSVSRTSHSLIFGHSS